MFLSSKKLNFLRALLSSEIPLRHLRNKNIRFPHPVGVVVSGSAKIGDNVIIFSNVTIGGMKRGPNKGFPVIGNNVTIYTGARIIGGITVGDNSVIGANAVVTKDVPPDSVFYSKPPVVVRNVEGYEGDR